MFTQDLGSDSSEHSHKDCGEDCDCSEEDERYLDQMAIDDFDEQFKKTSSANHTNDKEIFTEFNSEGLPISIRMLKANESIQIEQRHRPKLDKESPFPPTMIETVVTDPIIETLLTPCTVTAASTEAIALLRAHRQAKRRSKENDANPTSRRSSGSTTAHNRQPPSTPSEFTTLPHTLSTPNLPVFHPYTDRSLLEQYQIERAKNPASFDKTTAAIKKYLLNAKVERGGVNHLDQAEYSVDLASREDAKNVQRMALRRKRGMSDADSTAEESQEATVEDNDWLTPTSSTPQPSKASKPNFKSKSKSQPSSSRASSGFPSSEFDLIGHIAKYSVNGQMRHQHSRRVVSNADGQKTTLTTWIQITQEITVPSTETLGWEDVKVAEREKMRKMKSSKEQIAKKDETKDKDEASEDGSDGESDTDIDAHTEDEDEAAKLLGAIARIRGTGKLSQGVSLGRYLREFREEVINRRVPRGEAKDNAKSNSDDNEDDECDSE